VSGLGYKFVADVHEVFAELPGLMVEKQTFGRVIVDEEISLSTNPSDLAARLHPSHSLRPLVLATTVALSSAVWSKLRLFLTIEPDAKNTES
jgi:hypothetical protein